MSNAPTPLESDLMTESETAELVKQAPKTLANQRSRREGLPYIRLPGGAIRYSRRAVLARLAENTVDPRSPAA